MLPWLVAGRRLAVDIVGATVWAAGLAAATAAVADGAASPSRAGSPRAPRSRAVLAVMAAQARNTVNAEHDRA